MNLSHLALQGAAALAPVALLALYFHERTGSRTPPRAIAAGSALGVGAALAALGLQRFLTTSRHVSFSWIYDLPLLETLGGSGHDLARAFVYGGAVEEGLKLIGVGLVLWLFRRRLSPGAFVMVCVAVAGAFAAMENGLYIGNPRYEGVRVLVRAMIPASNHVFLGVIMAYFLVLAGRGGAWRLAILFAFAVPAALHGSGNYLLSLGSSSAAIPELWKIVSGLVHAALMVAEAVLAILVAGCAARMDAGDGSHSFRAAGFWRGHHRIRRLFWSMFALALGLLGAVHLIFTGMQAGGRGLNINSGLIFAIAGLSLLFAVTFWIHGRAPKSVSNAP